MNEQKDKALILAKLGAEILGATSGAIIGFLAGGVVTAGAGAALGTSITYVFKDIADRALSSREQIRVSTVANVAAESITHKLAAGANIRDDVFFERENITQSAGEQIFEGTLLKAKPEHEEKKIKHIGFFFANTAFDKTCTTFEANYLLQVASELTYSQFILLSIFGTPEKYPLRSSELSEKEVEAIQLSQLNLLQQTYALFQIEMIRFNSKEDGHADFLLDSHAINPSKVSLSTTGKRFFKMFKLSEIDKTDQISIAKIL